ncbi:phosphomevalonate kinase [Hirsutella rhossiliensis]|uniref:Phosphomevalonate kinase n=1 Tax=Hirsutella rhossiliensis TaxID=111463 RepID=A0A9P8N2K7_9HYPO|nr:phosphomevalonate kinase [Hirsutella rhossiliensis]KAH0965730.1 phosphomevalonate kinase [Hirsutella rhossiliensis]
MASRHPTVAVSAPGKVLLAGGYLVLDRQYTGLVFGLSARINVVAAEIRTSEGVQLNEIVVDSPQFLEAQWRYGYHLAPEGGGIKVTQLQVGTKISPNNFVETTLSYALTYMNQVAPPSSGHSIGAARLIILADNDYYSQTAASGEVPGRFAKFSVPLSRAHKTGLGSSAALVTSLTASLLSHYLPRDVFDVTTPAGKRTLHNLAQSAHCAAQGKVGSGFDVAAAVYGSCVYRRFSPELLSQLPEPGAPGFSERLAAVVDGGAEWDVEVSNEGLRMPKGVALRMCDVDCGSQSVGMAKKVLSWRSSDSETSEQLWDALQASNDRLGCVLREGAVDELPAAIGAVRALVREMGRLSDVPIEPEAQTELLDAVSAVEGVYGGVVPGAGGYDAVALLVDDGEETRRRLDARLSDWSRDKGSHVRLLDVEGEVEGVRREELDVYSGWV